MSKLAAALELAGLGYHVFPLVPGGKLPAVDEWQLRATRDAATIKRWWTDPLLEIEHDNNIGICTTRFGENQALLVVDVDLKSGKRGDISLYNLEVEGFSFPPTAKADTPSGGWHLFYVVDTPVRQGTNVFGDGVDTRSLGGFVVAHDSETIQGRYAWASDQRTPVRAPAWAVERCGAPLPARAERAPVSAVRIDQHQARDRAIVYLQSAPVAVEGQGGDATTFKVAAAVRDFGLDADATFDVLMEHWNDRCSPPWGFDDLRSKVRNAYAYASSAPGVRAPETVFTAVVADVEPAGHSAEPQTVRARPAGAHPFERLNSEFAFVLAGGGSHILWETVDAKGKPKLEHLAEGAFHKKFASQTMQVGKKSEPVTELWMKDKRRRSYDGICFMPGKEAPPMFYNLWRGFAVEPALSAVHPSLEMFKQHALVNVCGNDKSLYQWLMGYFAHMVQRPWEKPHTSPVFRGPKGVGKNVLLETVGYLLGGHFVLTANRRSLIGQFNGHLENCLFLVLNEAFWSGDKQAEGILKDLITGKTHNIEHKGKEIYVVDNVTRIAIIGNEDWIVPASHDERRFAVFDVGAARRQDTEFFNELCRGMEAGGYAALLRYLLDYDLAGLDLNVAPQTSGLLDQKHESLEPIYQWWLDCLTEGRIVGSDFDSAWPETVDTDRFRDAFKRYIRDRNIRSRVPDTRSVGRMLTRCAPHAGKVRQRAGDALRYVYQLGDLTTCRHGWDKFIGHPVAWD